MSADAEKEQNSVTFCPVASETRNEDFSFGLESRRRKSRGNHEKTENRGHPIKIPGRKSSSHQNQICYTEIENGEKEKEKKELSEKSPIRSICPNLHGGQNCQISGEQ